MLEAKTAGTLALVDAVRSMPGRRPDFVVLFSSLQSFIGNPGQSNYAAASTFQDSVGRASAHRAGVAVRVVNWGSWGDVGVAAGHRDRLLAAGALPIAPAHAMATLERLLGSPMAQLVVAPAAGDLLNRLARRPAASETETQRSAARLPPGAPGAGGPVMTTPLAIDADVTRATVVFLKDLFSGVLKIPASRIDSRTTFEHYGVDSLVIVELNRRLMAVVGELPATLLFEQKTVHALAGYLLHHHRERVIGQLAPRQATPPLTAEGVPPAPPANRLPVQPIVDGRAAPRPQPAMTISRSSASAVAIPARGISESSGLVSLAARTASAKCRRSAGTGVVTRRRTARINLASSAAAGAAFWTAWTASIRCSSNISPREARGDGPQERLFLETAWATLEDAGLHARAAVPRRRPPRRGVRRRHVRRLQAARAAAWQRRPADTLRTARTGLDRQPGVVHARSCSGPSLAVDTACSSSLTAVHLACESLRRGECDVGARRRGRTSSLHPLQLPAPDAGGMLVTRRPVQAVWRRRRRLSCRGEGVGAVLLKPLAQRATRRRSHHAVINGSRDQPGRQDRRLHRAESAGAGATSSRRRSSERVSTPADVSYVEAHGTGTALGDPIEMRGAGRARSAAPPPSGRAAVGSVKSNIGHLEAAAGIAGLTKVVLQMQHAGSCRRFTLTN